MELGMHGNMYA